MFRKILATVLVVTASASLPGLVQSQDRFYGNSKRKTVIVKNVRIYNATDHVVYVSMIKDKPKFQMKRIEPHSSRSFHNLTRTVINTGKKTNYVHWPRLSVGFYFEGVCPERDFGEVTVNESEYQVKGNPYQFGETWWCKTVRSWHREPDDEKYAGKRSGYGLVGDVQIRFPGRGDRRVTCRFSDGRAMTFREGYQRTFSIPQRGIYVRFPDGTGRIDGRTIHPGYTYLFRLENGALRLRTDRSATRR